MQKKILKGLRVLGFICLLLLATAGIGIPIPLYPKDEFEITTEQVDPESP